MEPDIRSLTFEETLGLLLGWMGRRVWLSVEVTAEPVTVAELRGVLAADELMAMPHDEDVFTFVVGEAPNGFTLHRAWHAGATVDETVGIATIRVGTPGSAGAAVVRVLLLPAGA